MSEIAAFTPEQARLLWLDYQQRQQLAPQIRQNFPQRRTIDEPSPHRVFIKNTSDETMPAFGCGQITGTEVVDGITVVQIAKPTSTDGEYLINSQFEIAAGGTGWAFRFGVVIMIGTAPSAPAEFRPTVGSWTVTEDSGPFVVFGAHNVAANGLIGRFRGGGGGIGLFAFALTADMVAKSAAANISTIDGVTQTFAEASVVYDPQDIFATLNDGDTGLCIKQAGKYYIIQANCPVEYI